MKSRVFAGLVVVCMVALTGWGLAQPAGLSGRTGLLAGPGPQEGGRPGAVLEGRLALEVIQRYLELTPEQVTASRAILETAREDAAGHVEALANLDKALLAEVNSEDPDVAVVGTLVLEIRSERDQLRVIREAAAAEVEALLSREQLVRLEAVKKAARLQPVVHAFQAAGLLPRIPIRPAENAE